jgi:hypothetical protein
MNHFEIFALSQERLFVHFDLLEKYGANWQFAQASLIDHLRGHGQTASLPYT